MSTFKKIYLFAAAIAMAMLLLGQASQVSAAPGAVFTTDGSCSGVDLNIYPSKDAVYLDGGPHHVGSAGLPSGFYFAQVTEPDGDRLGYSTTASVEVNALGEFVQCYQLSAILVKQSDGSPGYDTTTNPGGEYKVWISKDSAFTGGTNKTDNFKVGPEDDCTEDCTPQEQARLQVFKYYDANLNSEYDDGEALLPNWLFRVQDGINLLRFTPIDLIVAPDTYTVTEFRPLETNWINTDPAPPTDPLAKEITLADGDDESLYFGNVCIGAGGGKTLGFWSNKNGEKQINDGNSSVSELALLSGLNLRNANGTDFNPTGYTQFRTWILSANATNMAYMLSAQLAAMELNVEAGFVSGNAFVYAPDVDGANALGFIKISDLMAAANAALGADGFTPSGDANRAEQEDLKDALDDGNNNLNFLQADASHCPYTFNEPTE